MPTLPDFRSSWRGGAVSGDPGVISLVLGYQASSSCLSSTPVGYMGRMTSQAKGNCKVPFCLFFFNK